MRSSSEPDMKRAFGVLREPGPVRSSLCEACKIAYKVRRAAVTAAQERLAVVDLFRDPLDPK